MKLTLNEWQLLVRVLQEKDLEISSAQRKLFSIDPKIEEKWDLYTDTGEYEEDATEEEKENIPRYDNLKHESIILSDLINTIRYGEAEL